MEDFDGNSGGRKERHGCVTTWLVLLIIANSLVALVYFFMRNVLLPYLPETVTSSAILLLGGLAVLNVVCAVLLFSWKKVGFYGLILTNIAGIIINYQSGIGGVSSIVMALASLGILFGILQIKKDDKSAWDGLD
jgi:hypothetical protein